MFCETYEITNCFIGNWTEIFTYFAAMVSLGLVVGMVLGLTRFKS